MRYVGGGGGVCSCDCGYVGGGVCDIFVVGVAVLMVVEVGCVGGFGMFVEVVVAVIDGWR